MAITKLHINLVILALLPFLFAGTLLFGSSFAQAQITPSAPAVQYQAIVLKDNLSGIDFKGRSYIVKEDSKTISLQDMVEKVKSGNVIPNMSDSRYIDLGLRNSGTWIVFPVKNISSRDVWNLDLGSLHNGRFAPLKDIVLYNMSKGEFVVNTQAPTDKKQNISPSIALKIASNEINFFILYVKPNLGIPTYLTPSLNTPNNSGVFDIFSRWVIVFLSIGAFIYFLKLAVDTGSLANAVQSLIWLTFSVPIFLCSNFLYIGDWDIELLYPFAWMVATLSLMLNLIIIKESRNELPVSLFSGLASAGFITCLLGIVLLKMLPDIATYLIYVPSFLSCLIVVGTSFQRSLRPHRRHILCVTSTALLLGITIVWFAMMSFHIIPAEGFTALFPTLLLSIAIVVAVATTVPPSPDQEIAEIVSEDIFSEHQLNKSESLMIHEAKEQSEHHRLMQVIEQERKLMADLQVKSAQQTEEMRKAKDAADEANRAKSAFLAVVSHEIRTPMTGIMGMLRLLQETQLSKEQKEYASTIKDSGDAMLALLNDILDFEKIESGKMDLEHINFDFKRLIRSVTTLMSGHAEAKNIKLQLEVDPNTPNWLYGDPTRLRQVLLNLINNAIKFTSKGSVYLRIRNLTGESGERNENSGRIVHQIYIAVQDSGIGIGAASQKKLFMPFAQADSSINRKYGGTGLGLAICKRLIEAMGGAISISSKEGEGSTFFFTISMEEGQEIDEDSADSVLSKENAPMQKANFQLPISVLVVDDNGINQKVVSGFAEKLGAKTMTAGTGADALDMLAKHQFNLILMDLELPDMNGIDVTQAIRALSIPSKANVPIVALTGNTDDENIKACYEAGMNDFAAKPITFERIAELLNKVDTQYYASQKANPLIDFSEHPTSTQPDFTENALPDETLSEVSPLAAYSSQLNAATYLKESPSAPDSAMSSSEETHAYLDDEDDSFSMAVKKFEELERLDAPPSSFSADQEEINDDDLSHAGLDESILESLKGGLSNDQIKEILVSFYEKADELIAEIGNTYINGDAIALNARAHELKGMAGNFGFSEISRMCAIIEKAAKEKQLTLAKESIQHLGEKYAISRGYLNKWLTEK